MDKATTLEYLSDKEKCLVNESRGNNLGFLHMQRLGVQFTENQFCRGTLTLLFGDIVIEVDGAVLFMNDIADQIIY